MSRGAQRAFLVGDLPFGSYEVSAADAVRSAMRMVKEGQMDAVKLEGGLGVIDSVLRGKSSRGGRDGQAPRQ